MEVFLFVWSVLCGWWSKPNLDEVKDHAKTILSFLIFAPASIYFATKAFGDYGVLSFIPLAFGYVSAHPITLLAKASAKK